MTGGGGRGGLGSRGLGLLLPLPAPVPAPFVAPPIPFRLRPLLVTEFAEDGVPALAGSALGDDERESGDDDGSRSRNDAVEDSRSREGTLDCEFVGAARGWFWSGRIAVQKSCRVRQI